ncbi:uncharacterized protein LOC103957586 [Pyrus x bretschneideri]|uniref:uncharacterized protein LOC103957586 n=1 Tax=Pyrus x bretschneideri TaxID=225117 RepID=UPI00202E4A44|nr:uncharacterized protein LOC103957586 [Pyrus x bretschneideri]
MSRRAAGPGSESGRMKNPPKPMKLRDKTMSRRVAGPGSESGSPKFVRLSRSLSIKTMEDRLLEVTRSNFKSLAEPKKLRDMKKMAVKDSPTQLKNENVVREGMAQLQLNEENTTTPKPEERKMHSAVVFTRPFKFTIPCKVCGVVGHLNDSCPYMTRVPNNVTEVGKGYEIVTFRGERHAVRMVLSPPDLADAQDWDAAALFLSFACLIDIAVSSLCSVGLCFAGNQGEIGLKLEGVASGSTHGSVVNLVVIQSDPSATRDSMGRVLLTSDMEHYTG